MLVTYARYKYTQDLTGRRLGKGWHKVTKEYIQWYPSGRHNTVVINGCAVKACHCEVVQVIEQYNS